MTKEAFLSQLKSCMAARNIDRATAEKFLQRFESIMNGTPPEELQQKIASFGTPEEIAGRISRYAETAAGGSAPGAGGAATSPPRAMRQTPPERQAPPSQGVRRTPKKVGAAPTATAGGNQTSSPSSFPASSERAQEGAEDVYGRKEPGKRQTPSGRSGVAGAAGGAGARPSAPASQPAERKQRQEKERQPIVLSKKGERNFLWTLLLTSPVWGFLLCALCGVFLLAYTAILFLSALLIACEVVLIVGGVLLAVVGIVYGVMKMLPGAEASYIGLYELGLGIRVGGFTMLFSILVYNLVVNLTPFALKQLTRFAKFTAGGILTLVRKVRKEFGKL